MRHCLSQFRSWTQTSFFFVTYWILFFLSNKTALYIIWWNHSSNRNIAGGLQKSSVTAISSFISNKNCWKQKLYSGVQSIRFHVSWYCYWFFVFFLNKAKAFKYTASRWGETEFRLQIAFPMAFRSPSIISTEFWQN